MSHEFDEKAATWDDDPVRVARAADVARQIRERTSLGAGTHVLDFGCGTGLLGFHLLPDVASVTFADPSAGMLDQVERKLRLGGHGTGRTLLLDPEVPALPMRYGAIVSLMTLHHVPDPETTLRLAAAHVEPGGWLAVCDLDTEDGSFHDDPHAQVHHGFERGALVALLEVVGFEDVAAATAWVMREERPDGVREYPLFLLTGRRRG